MGGGVREVKPSIHFHCVLHAKSGRGGGGGVQKACRIAYVLDGRPLTATSDCDGM